MLWFVRTAAFPACVSCWGAAAGGAGAFDPPPPPNAPGATGGAAKLASVLLETHVVFRRELRAGDVVDVTCDVKFGSGAFMKSLNDARALARSLVDTGKRMGMKTSALLTDMNQPLGRMAGNLVEVRVPAIDLG